MSAQQKPPICNYKEEFQDENGDIDCETANLSAIETEVVNKELFLQPTHEIMSMSDHVWA